ncbi:hypothetical protein [Cupriavidus alkaliphilus]|uniref:hypothetical protein n=1 Tax=Cupriavidus alkaliphilus TaxID=942866 RepID=UPI00339D48EF
MTSPRSTTHLQRRDPKLRSHAAARQPTIALDADLISFTHAPSPHVCIRLCRALAVMEVALDLQGMRDPLLHVRSAQLALVAVMERRDRIGVFAVSELDALTLRAAAPLIAEAFGRIRLGAFFLANAIVTDAEERARDALPSA